jgi:putative nucleotidyltransferase with HDIG domain
MLPSPTPSLLPPARPPEPEVRAATEDDLHALHQSLDSVSVARPAAAHVLAVVDDPTASAQKVAASAELDPVFAAQLIKLANSAYYGMSGRVGNTSFAVTVIGFSAVRSLAALSASGLDATGKPKPEGFWLHAAAAAAGCSAVAAHFGLVTGDAFAAGLLHDLGLALLHGFDRDLHQSLIERWGSDDAALSSAEATTFGLSHAAAAARVLASWRFPDDFVAAVAAHHGDEPPASPLAAAVRVGDLLAHARDRGPEELTDREAEQLAAAGIRDHQWDDLLESTRLRTIEITASLPSS